MTAPAPTIRATTTGFLDGSSSAVTLPTHEKEDYLFIWIGCAGDAGTMDAPATWERLLEAKTTDHTSPFINGGLFQAYGKIADATSGDDPTIVKDVARVGWYIALSLVGVDTRKTAIGASVEYPIETSTGDPLPISFMAQALPLIVVLVGHSDVMNPFPGPANMGTQGFGASGSNGLGTGGVLYQITGDEPMGGSFDPAVYTMRDNPFLSGIHYAPHVVTTIGFYGNFPFVESDGVEFNLPRRRLRATMLPYDLRTLRPRGGT